VCVCVCVCVCVHLLTFVCDDRAHKWRRFRWDTKIGTIFPITTAERHILQYEYRVVDDDGDDDDIVIVSMVVWSDQSGAAWHCDVCGQRQRRHTGHWRACRRQGTSLSHLYLYRDDVVVVVVVMLSCYCCWCCLAYIGGWQCFFWRRQSVVQQRRSYE
jgi:hypothetical protein